MHFKKIVLFFIILFLLPILYYKSFFTKKTIESTHTKHFSTHSSKNLNHKLSTNSKHIIAIDRKNLHILYEKDAFSKTAMASTTKIMTCILTIENCSLTEKVTVSKKASSVSGSQLDIIEGNTYTVSDLLYGLMLRSGNDCAIALAEYISNSTENFSLLMNQKAKELNLKNTNFVTPHGLDDKNHYTTAYDLAILTDYALKNNIFKKLVSTKKYYMNFNGYNKELVNTNELLGSLSGVYGVKTGFTFDAGRCLVTSCQRNDIDIIIVVLGADTKKSRGLDTINIINYIFENFEYVDISQTIYEAFDYYSKKYKYMLIIKKSMDMPILELSPLDNYLFLLNTSEGLNLTSKLYTNISYSPRSSQNSVIGKISLYNKKDLLCEINIIQKNTLNKNDYKYYFEKIFDEMF